MYSRQYEERTKFKKHLVVIFYSNRQVVLTDFLSGEMRNFSLEIKQALDEVFLGKTDIVDFSGNMVACEGNAQEVEVYYNYMEEELGPSVFMSTAKLKELVDEWIEMEDKFRKGELDGKLPLVIED